MRQGFVWLLFFFFFKKKHLIKFEDFKQLVSSKKTTVTFSKLAPCLPQSSAGRLTQCVPIKMVSWEEQRSKLKAEPAPDKRIHKTICESVKMSMYCNAILLLLCTQCTLTLMRYNRQGGWVREAWQYGGNSWQPGLSLSIMRPKFRLCSWHLFVACVYKS